MQAHRDQISEIDAAQPRAASAAAQTMDLALQGKFSAIRVTDAGTWL